MIRKTCILIIALGLLGDVFLSVCLAVQSPDGNQYDTELSITHLDISFKTDFQSNNIDTVVKASLENWSENTVDSAEFWVCPGMNDPELSAEIKHINFLDKDEKRDLKYTTRKTDGRNIYVVLFKRPVRPSEKLELEFEYTMKGKSDFSGGPIGQSEDGVKELFLRGDYYWCPSLFFDSKKDVFAKLYQPSWKLSIEYPAGYVAVADGELVSRDQRDGMVKEEWKSLLNGRAQVFISKYKVERRTTKGITLEVYVTDEELLKRAAGKFDDYARIFNLYVDMYGHPGYSIYRIVCSPLLKGGGLGLVMGQIIDMEIETVAKIQSIFNVSCVQVPIFQHRIQTLCWRLSRWLDQENM